MKVPFDARCTAGVAVGLALLLGAASVAESQVRVEGEVVDEINGTPVAGVIVQFPDVGLAALTDSLGYFLFESVPGGVQIISTYHFAYEALQAATPIVLGEVLALNLTPRPITLGGVAVDVTPREEIELLRDGRASDYIGREVIEDYADRTNKLLEVMRAKAPPRLQIRQMGSRAGMSFCIQSSRQSPSIQELKDLGVGCRPSLLVLDGVVVFAPPSTSDFTADQAATMPDDVASMLLNQNPEVIESVSVLTPRDAFFRYGDAGRLGAVVITTKRPFKVIRR